MFKLSKLFFDPQTGVAVYSLCFLILKKVVSDLTPSGPD